MSQFVLGMITGATILLLGQIVTLIVLVWLES